VVTGVLAVALSTACGTKFETIDQGPGGAGTGAGGTGAEGGSGGAGGTSPEDCAVSTALSPPYEVTFRFLAGAGPETWLRQDCEIVFAVTSCADDYATPLALWPGCTVDCSDTNPSCMACGACMTSGVLVDLDQPLEVLWEGNTYTFGQTVAGCDCATPHAAPAAHYHLEVPVFASEQDATQGGPIWMTAVDFELPAPGGVVEITLGGGV